MQSNTLTVPQARRLIAEARLSPLQRRLEMLTLPDALNVYRLGSPQEQTAWQPVMLRKLMSAARSQSLSPAQVQQAQGLGMGPRPAGAGAGGLGNGTGGGGAVGGGRHGGTQQARCVVTLPKPYRTL